MQEMAFFIKRQEAIFVSFSNVVKAVSLVLHSYISSRFQFSFTANVILCGHVNYFEKMGRCTSLVDDVLSYADRMKTA